MEVQFSPDQAFLDRLNEVEDSVNEMKFTMAKMDGKIEQIYNVIVGNETFDQEGIISRLKKLEIETEGLNALKNKLIGAFIVGGAAWAIIWEFVKNMIKK